MGADRSIKRLSLTTLGELKLLEPNGTRPGPTRAPLQTSVRDALSMIRTAGGGSSDGGRRRGPRRQGPLTLGLIEQLLSEAAANGNGDGSPSSLVVEPALDGGRTGAPAPAAPEAGSRTVGRGMTLGAPLLATGSGHSRLQRAQQQVRRAGPLLLHGWISHNWFRSSGRRSRST